ncbi:MAG TPA: hypothetical protein VMC86_11290 [Gemmatimonadales bacterium]|nr:hypothetical protein [Gemmatimonadales bacterium]
MLPLLAALILAPPVTDSTVKPGVFVDKKHHRITIVAGPYTLPPMGRRMEMMGMDMSMDHMGEMASYFVWPEQGWFYGFHVSALDGHGAAMPRDLIHHFTLLNFDRRTLFDPFAERLASARYENEDVVAPKTLGAPLTRGTRMGVYMMWFNSHPDTVKGVYVKLTLLYMPANMQPPPTSALPVVMDVDLFPGADNMYPVPPGKTERTRVFRFPIPGRLLAAGGHLHEYGAYIRLEDSVSGKVLVDLHPVFDAQGHMLGMTRKLFAVSGPGLRIEANHPYRLIAAYDNTTKDTLREAMGELMAIFSADDFSQWPKMDYANKDLWADLATYGITALPDSLTAASRAATAGRQ